MFRTYFTHLGRVPSWRRTHGFDRVLKGEDRLKDSWRQTNATRQRSLLNLVEKEKTQTVVAFIGSSRWQLDQGALQALPWSSRTISVLQAVMQELSPAIVPAQSCPSCSDFTLRRFAKVFHEVRSDRTSILSCRPCVGLSVPSAGNTWEGRRSKLQHLLTSASLCLSEACGWWWIKKPAEINNALYIKSVRSFVC